ncbi:MAG: hypothetical protein IJM57_02385 [Lachnospiraceae bacterium]|nr:hypothetical protein [Lachnospiraceae bacterium]
MKKENDFLHIVAGIDDRLIEEADPYREKTPKTGKTKLSMYRLRMIAGVAAAAVVLIVGVWLVKSGVLKSPPAGPGQTVVTTPTPPAQTTPTPEMPQTTSTPTPELPKATPTPDIPKITATPTPGIPKITATPTPDIPKMTATPTPDIPKATPTPGIPKITATPTPDIPKITATPTPGIPDATPTPTMGVPQPTPTPIGESGLTNPFTVWNYLNENERVLSKEEAMASEYYPKLSKELRSLYAYHCATQRDAEYDRYNAIWFYKDNGNDYDFLGVVVRKKEDVVNYEERLISAADADLYDVRDREDPLWIVDAEEFNSSANSPIFRPEEFTDEVLKRRIVHHSEDGEEYDQMWFGIDMGEEVFLYLFHGTAADATASLFVPSK